MSVKKVLVIRFRRIGDAVLSVVICSSIRKSFPEAEIHYVLNDHIAPLFENHPDIDKIITFSDEENNHFFKYLRKVRQLMKTERYDVIIDTRATIKTLWFSAFSLRTKYRIGTSKFYNHFFHNYRVRNHVNDDLDEVVRNLLLLQPLEREGKLVMTTDFRLYVTEQETAEFKSYMDRFHVHQSFDLFLARVGNTGSLGDQFFIIFDLCLSAITADQQPVTFSSLIWKLDIKAKFLIDHYLKIALAYIISSGRNHFALHRLVMFIFYPESDLALRGLSQSPSVQCNGIFTDTDHIHFILHLPYRPLHFHLSGQSSAVLLRSQEDASSRAD